jgi:hypothetical protein
VFDRQGKKVEVTGKSAREQDRKEKKKRFITRVRIRRLGEARPGAGVRLKIMTVFDDGSKKIGHWDGQGRWIEFTYTGKSRVKYAQVDPDRIFLIDRDLSNNSYTAKTKAAGAMRWSSRLLFWVQNLLQFASAL